jgi:ankyrin repeat protein
MTDDEADKLDGIYGPDVSAALADDENNLDLHTAASVGDMDRMIESVGAGKELGAGNMRGWTPIMYAAYCGHDHVVEFLLDNSVAMGARNDRGRTAVMLGAMCGNDAVAEVIVRRGGGDKGPIYIQFIKYLAF